MRKTFIFLWSVVGLFGFGIFLAIFTAFTTQDTSFTGSTVVHVTFVKDDHPASWPARDLQARFEARQTNWFETFSGGPLPRTAIVSFQDPEGKHHEFIFKYDRHGKVWEGEVAFPDPSINALQIESSSLDFKGVVDGKRFYAGEISAYAMIGAPIIKND